jgi:hypothetical protein
VHEYIKHVHNKENKDLKDVEVQKGVKAIMGLARAAAAKVDDLCKVLKIKSKKIKDLAEYKKLENFYQKEVITKFKEAIEADDEWVKEFESKKEGEGGYLRKIHDLQEVKRDQSYELFYIKKESGQPFFGTKLLQNLKLVTDFDEMMIEVVGDDPLIYTKVVQDQDASVAANEILGEIKENLAHFITIAKDHPKDSLIGATYKAILALMAAANKDNILLSKRRKSALGYFHDFHYYLRALLTHEDYLRFRYENIQTHGYERDVITLIHQMCSCFFLHDGDQIKTTSFIKDLIKKGQIKEKPQAKFSIWTWILDCYDSVHHLLKHYPNGPLLKILDVFKDREYELGFDPLSEGNIPSRLFSFQIGSIRTTCLRIPSPTTQKVINQASIAEEFRGMLRYLVENKSEEKFLIFNLQDRTSWKEHARADSLEGVQKEGDFYEHLFVVTLPKDTAFYFQNGEYAAANDANTFKSMLLEQIKNGKSCGFYIPTEMDHRDIFKFSEKALHEIHSHFFGNKNVLTRKNRLDFIEIFYLFLQLKMIVMIKPTYLSFSCKDGIDVGAMASFGFFGLLKLFLPKCTWTEEEKDALLKMIFAPALLIRERNVDILRLSRTVSILALINSETDVHQNALKTIAEALFKKSEIEEIEITL